MSCFTKKRRSLGMYAAVTIALLALCTWRLEIDWGLILANFQVSVVRFTKNVSSNGLFTAAGTAVSALDYRCDIHCRSVCRHASCLLLLSGYLQQNLPLPGAEISGPRSCVIDQKYSGGCLGGSASTAVVR